MVYVIPNCDMFQFTRNHFQGVIHIIKIRQKHTLNIYMNTIIWNTVPDYIASVDTNDDKYSIKTGQGSI
jgi:hypothetical protein